MNEAGAFAAKLSLVLKALSLSRGRLAAEIGVDKSLVSRWCAGNFIPAPHNLSRLSQAIAARKPGFSMAGWDADIDTLASRFGVEVSPPPDTQRGAPSGIAEWLMIPKLREAAMSSGAVAAAVAGFWRTTRPYPEWPGR
jgi:transcriptional regulator with XRE-family HTH domain